MALIGPIDLKKWTLRDFPLMHKYTESVIFDDIVKWLDEFMGPAAEGPIPDSPYNDRYLISYYGPGWHIETRHYPGSWTNDTYVRTVSHFLYFEEEQLEVMFRLVWR